jgi:hypothetical protein
LLNRANNSITESASRKLFISSLLHCRRDPTILRDNKEVLGRIFELVSRQYRDDAVVAITAANAITHAFSRKVIDPEPILLEKVRDLVLSSIPLIPGIHSIHIARCMRAVSNLERLRMEDSGEYVKTLVEEASMPLRLSSYSATDLSEIIHSVHQLNRIDEDTIRAFQEKLFQELVSREPFIRIKNELHKKDPQSLSMIGVSNILFVSRHNPDLSDEVGSMFGRLMGSKKITESVAIEGSTIFHLVSILDSLIMLESYTSVRKAIKRIVPVIIAKRDSGIIPLTDNDLEHVSKCLDRVQNSFKNSSI